MYADDGELIKKHPTILLRKAGRDVFKKDMINLQYLKLQLNEINLYDSIFGFFTSRTQVKYVSGEPGVLQSFHKPETDEVFQYFFELDTKGTRHERIVLNFERALTVVGGVFTFLMMITQFTIRPFVQDQLIHQVIEKLTRSQ